MPTITKLFSAEEIALHNTREDCWIVVEGNVYDVSSYLDDHPGGEDVILETVGKDATDGFEDAGHSKEARELLDTFFLGELDTSAPSIPELETSSKDQNTWYCKKLNHLPEQYWAVPVAILGFSLVVGFLYLRKK